MKAVLLNDFKILKKSIAGYLFVIFLIFILSFFIIGTSDSVFFINWIAIMILSMRNSVIFDEKFEDFEKFMTMPVSIEEYSLAKILKNSKVLFISYIFLIAYVFITNKNYFPAAMAFMALDIMLISFFHILYTDNIKLILVIIYTVLLVLVGSILVFNWQNFLEYKYMTIIISIIFGIFSIYLDYKFSTNLLKARKE
ncbi:hypothetical protein KQI68_07600 [Peptoniphilus sp. MSJ-1]|uniref:ABC-2 family transporter protein n=1 Tax=Peptoniphilus ovalis TaxID=2841503 RepID=A0ABS6FHN9_9FIRM|nr:hypothetical protein [Peptoniphilus ovalis]MBU5669696.1 hypothetical protein [Peptoniphilus ovalis]